MLHSLSLRTLPELVEMSRINEEKKYNLRLLLHELLRIPIGLSFLEGHPRHLQEFDPKELVRLQRKEIVRIGNAMKSKIRYTTAQVQNSGLNVDINNFINELVDDVDWMTAVFNGVCDRLSMSLSDESKNTVMHIVKIDNATRESGYIASYIARLTPVAPLQMIVSECPEPLFEPGELCSICFDMLDAQCSAKTNCDHVFCIGCIHNWASRSDSNKGVQCPLCRSEVSNIMVAPKTA